MLLLARRFASRQWLYGVGGALQSDGSALVTDRAASAFAAVSATADTLHSGTFQVISIIGVIAFWQKLFLRSCNLGAVQPNHGRNQPAAEFPTT